MFLNISFLLSLFLNNANCLELKIEGEQIYIKQEAPTMELPITMTNRSDHVVLCYNFYGAPIQGLSENLLCNGEGSAGFWLIIFDKNFQIVYPEISMPDSVHYQSLDMLNYHLEQAKIKFRNGRVTIGKGQSYRKILKINLEEYKLTKGKYVVQLIYRSGSGILNEINEAEIAQDEKKEGAKTYFGCAKSNVVNLIVS